jgi:hypothetical protein
MGERSMVVSYEVMMVCGPDGCRRAVVALKDDAPWDVEHEADGVLLACQVKPPQKMPGTANAVDKFCIRIPASLLQKLWEATGPDARG